MRKEAEERESLLAIPLISINGAHGTDRLHRYIYNTDIKTYRAAMRLNAPSLVARTKIYIKETDKSIAHHSCFSSVLVLSHTQFFLRAGIERLLLFVYIRGAPSRHPELSPRVGRFHRKTIRRHQSDYVRHK
jgi:hypothetical protein